MSLRRLGLAIIAIGYLPVGLWATFAPRSFYDNFPGLGHHWVRGDPPFNQHLVTDVGGLNLALGAIAVVALIALTPMLVRATALGALLYEVPHALFHAQHLDHIGNTTDQVLAMGSFVLVILSAIALLVFDRR
jgi:hypothetical protein